MRALKKLGQSGAGAGGSSKRTSSKPDVSGPAKRQEVDGLLARLRDDVELKKMTEQERSDTLGRLKILGRAAEDADPIFTKEGINTLARASLDTDTPIAVRDGLRCLANALLLKQETRQFFVDGGFPAKVAELLKKENFEDQFLAARLLFLLTYDTDLDFEALEQEHQLCSTINESLSTHLKLTLKRSRKTPRPAVELDALTEVLKLLFNLTHHYASLCAPFDHSIEPIIKLLLREKKTIPEPRPILSSPTVYLVNALMNLNLPEKVIDQKSDAEELINILDCAIEQYPLAQLDNTAPPLLELIRRVYELGPDAVRRYMAWLLLPTDDERSKPLGTSNTLSARLLRLSISANTPNLKEPISNLMFELSDKDVDVLVKNIGYGFAAGFLASHDMPAPSNANARASMDNSAILNGGPLNPTTAGDRNAAAEGDGSNAGHYTPGPDEVNFVTGQYLVNEPQDEEPEMSEDEKLREAEKMFTLFERLKATGVVDVENPVAAAARQGRLEELPD